MIFLFLNKHQASVKMEHETAFSKHEVNLTQYFQCLMMFFRVLSPSALRLQRTNHALRHHTHINADHTEITSSVHTLAIFGEGFAPAFTASVSLSPLVKRSLLSPLS